MIRGSMYWSWASSTWSFPSLVRARLAKMSRISPVLSMIRTPKARSKFRCWAGDNSSSKMQRSMSSCWAKRDSSWTLPFPMKNTGSGLGRDWTNFPTTSAPAVSASWASSSTESWAHQREAVSPQAREISMARSGPSARLWPRDRLAKIFSTVWTTLPKGMVATSFALKGPNSWSTGC